MTTPINAPISAEELLTIRQHQRTFDLEIYKLSNTVYAAQSHDYRKKSYEYVKEYGILTIRTLFILNGAAILGLLTFIAAFFTKNDQTILLIGISLAHSLVWSFYFFGAGLLCAAIISGIGYLNYSSAHELYDTPVSLFLFINNQEKPSIDERYRVFTVRTAAIALVVGILGLVCFVIGAANVAYSFSILGA